MLAAAALGALGAQLEQLQAAKHNAEIHFRGVSAPVGIGPLKAAREGYAGGKKGIKGFPTFPRGGKKQGIRGEPIRR